MTRALSITAMGLFATLVLVSSAHAQPASHATIISAMTFVSQHSAEFGTGICQDGSKAIHISNSARFIGGRIKVSTAMEGAGTVIPRREYSMSVLDWDQVQMEPIYFGCPSDGRQIVVACKAAALCVTVTEGGRALPPMNRISLRIFPPAEAARVFKAIGIIRDPTCWGNPGCSF